MSLHNREAMYDSHNSDLDHKGPKTTKSGRTMEQRLHRLERQVKALRRELKAERKERDRIWEELTDLVREHPTTSDTNMIRKQTSKMIP
jgi:hypothetical protein